ncbi:arginine N-methyltransferase 2, partial [Aureobasidium melanogenum]
DRLLDADKNGVMMSWETDIMQKTVDRLCPEPGLRVLNVGHGMGIIDGIFQDKKVAVHHIIEAHPDVLARMRKDGWYEKPGVKIHEGRWQDVVPKLVEQNEVFDGIYFDTFAEEYKALKEFFTEYVIGLLDPEGRFGFFNGLGADRQVCYDVYTRVVEMDLFDAGMDTEFEDIHIPDLDEQGEWEGVRRRYWALDNYRMPTCKFVG